LQYLQYVGNSQYNKEKVWMMGLGEPLNKWLARMAIVQIPHEVQVMTLTQF
jgi:adenine C2-methylase RlmN of 23S rRNA A2503 and tRNA A37